MIYLLLACFLGAYIAQAADSYCDGGPTSEQDSNLGAVILGDINDQSDCPGQQGIQDKTSMSTGLKPGSSYTLKYTVTTCGQPYTRASAAWIDWNNNKEFESGEQLGTTQSTSANDPSQEITVQFTVPADAELATTRMRVMVQESSNPSLDPCSIYAYGGAKDFSVVVSKSGKSGGGSGDGLSGGWIFIILLLTLTPTYFGAGFYLNRKKGLEGSEAIPNIGFWREFPTYVSTGCQVSLAATKSFIAKIRGQEETTTYEEI